MATVKPKAETDLIHQNMRIYGQVQNTPNEAKRTIGAGRLKGFTDINAMWRIKKLTELFGPCGFGWWTQNEQYTLTEGPVVNEKTGAREIACFCVLQLVYVDPETKQESHPITGVGGNKFIAMERNGPYCNDEAYKMAYTDALSIACKALGFSSDIYFGEDRSKYRLPEDAEKTSNDNPKQNTDTAQSAAKETPGMSIDEMKKALDLKIGAMAKTLSQERQASMANWLASKLGDADWRKCTDAAALAGVLKELQAA